MGTWSASVYGNDTAQDLKSEYKAAFLYNDFETALQKIDSYVRGMFDESDEEEWSSYYYSLADFMWKHGILTEEIREKAIEMIDSGFGLDIWADEGQSVLNKRKKVLAQLREKLLSPMPPPKKIRLDRYLKPIFETGDLVAFQLKTADKHYLSQCFLPEEEFRNYEGKYVVFRKVGDKINHFSSIEPDIKEYWAIFQLYCNVFDTCPTAEDLEGIPFADPLHPAQRKWVREEKYSDTFVSESSMVYFRRRNYVVIGKNLEKLPERYNNNAFIFMGGISTDTEIINTIYR